MASWQAHNPTYSSFFFEASPSKQDGLTNVLTNGHAFKKARCIEYDVHEPQPPFRRVVDGVVMLGQTMTHQTLTSMLPPGVRISKTPPYDPPTGDAWTASKMYEYVRRGNQPIGEYQQFAATGPTYDANAGQIFAFGMPPRQGHRTDIDEMMDEAKAGMD